MNGRIHYYGVADRAAQFVLQEQLLDVTLWRKFVDQFRLQEDAENCGWRGEYWGKMMRGGAMVYAYTGDETLYAVLCDTVKDMMTVMEEDGRVSTYARDKEFDAWDLWCRKYVMLGMEYFLDACKDAALYKKIVGFLSRMADYITLRIGNGEGQKNITDASRSWFGINSSSILEPFVRLYRLTNEKRYLDFATYIVENGGAKGINIFDLAYENKLLPYQYGVSKAYEMMSCFEGLLEYYFVTGIEKYKTAVINFAKAVLMSECSIIGSCGITHELFDHTVNRQTVEHGDVMQETCVTVTWMKFCGRVLALTDDSSFADAMERSFYNAYLGSLNTEHKISPYIYEKYVVKNGLDYVLDTYLAFDSYSPLTPGKRGKKVGGNQLLSDRSYYGCCACIGAAGVGSFIEHALVVKGDVVTLNFFEKGEASFFIGDTLVSLHIDTAYPKEGDIRISVKTDKPIAFTLRIRIPGWTGKGGYHLYRREWSDDIISVCYPMELVYHKPITWDTDTVYTDTSKCTAVAHFAYPVRVEHKPCEDRFIALTRGPITLGADARLGKDVRGPFLLAKDPEPRLEQVKLGETVPILCLSLKETTGERLFLVDYASAGRDWESMITAWLPTE